jgi:hypothetical protein
MASIDLQTGRAARWGLGLTLLAAALAVLSGPLYRMKLLALFPAFTLLRWAVYAVIAGALVCLVALVVALLRRSRAGGEAQGAGAAALGVLVGLVVAYVPYSVRAGNPPPIHDVTTDTDDPPAFVAALAPRRASGATNSPEYDRIVRSPRGGPDFNVPELQKKAFPDIAPVRLAVAPAQAFEQALAAVSAMGWTLIGQGCRRRPHRGLGHDHLVRLRRRRRDSRSSQRKAAAASMCAPCRGSVSATSARTRSGSAPTWRRSRPGTERHGTNPGLEFAAGGPSLIAP